MMNMTARQRFNQIAFLSHVASKNDVDRKELLTLLKQIKTLALNGGAQ
jgi:hypothetical protein